MVATDNKLILSGIGFFITLNVLLSLAGIGTTDTSSFIPSAPPQRTDENGVLLNNESQLLLIGVFECVVSLFSDCSVKTQTSAFNTISDIFAWSGAAFSFTFRLVTFQISEIPVWVNMIIVMPIAGAISFIGLKIIRGVSG